MKIKIEMETKEFNKALKTFMKKSDLSAEKVIKKTAFDLLGHILGKLPGEQRFGLSTRALAKAKDKSITGRHPVDTGRARAAWYPSVRGLGGNFNFSSGDNIKTSEVEKGKKEGAFTDRTKNKNLKYVDLINGVRYIILLEYGYSKTAPIGMVRVSMRQMYGAIPNMLGQEFIQEWNKVGL